MDPRDDGDTVPEPLNLASVVGGHFGTWVRTLKAGYDAGYYVTEAAEGEQTPIPWLGKTCINCPFYVHGTCHVLAETRKPDADTCLYFDPEHHHDAEGIIRERMQGAVRNWWGRMR